MIAASPIRPVIGAALPNLVIEGDLRFANGYVQALRNAALTLAPWRPASASASSARAASSPSPPASLLLSVSVLACVRGRFHGAQPHRRGSTRRWPGSR